MNVLSLFSGIGGLDLGLERAGMTICGQVEIDPWCRKILAKHWPEVPRHDDVRTCAAWWQALADTSGPRHAPGRPEAGGQVRDEARGTEPERRGGASGTAVDKLDDKFVIDGARRPAVDLVCGGFPCQPVSLAGKRLAQADSRWLWPATRDVIRDLGPRWVLLENVPGLLGRGMGDVLGDLAACGYDAEWDCVPACFVGAPHIRDRVFVVAYPQSHLRRASGDDRPASSNGSHPRVADAEGQCGELRQATRQRLRRPPGSRDDVADADGAGLREQRRPKPVPAQLAAAECSRHELADPDSPARNPAGTASQTVFRPGTLQRPGRCGCGDRHTWPAEPAVGRVAHGIPRRVDRLRGLGNAVVPQVAEHVGRLIMEAAA